METLHLLLIIWILITVVALTLVILNLLSTQAMLDKLKTTETVKWQDFKSMSQLALEHILWILLSLVLVSELISISFIEVRSWVGMNRILGSVLYILPILVLSALLIVRRLKNK